jgi:hypothetical protein
MRPKPFPKPETKTERRLMAMAYAAAGDPEAFSVTTRAIDSEPQWEVRGRN